MDFSRKTVLLVEDNQDDEALALRAMGRCDVENNVVVVRDGAEAKAFFDSLKPNSVLPSLVLLDLKLPKASGLEVLAHIRKSPFGQYLPVVILTSSDEESDILESYRIGANSYIRKAVDFGTFTDEVRQLTAYWLAINQPATSSPVEAHV